MNSPGLLPRKNAEELREKTFNEKISLNEYISPKIHPRVKQDLHQIHLGLQVLEMQKHEDAIILRYQEKNLVSLLQGVVSGKLNEVIAVPLLRAKRIGKILEIANFNFTFQTYHIPEQLLHPSTEKIVRLLFARCDALSIQHPDLTKITPTEFMKMIESEKVLSRLTTAGNEYMMDYQVTNQAIYMIALDKLSSMSRTKYIDKRL